MRILPSVAALALLLGSCSVYQAGSSRSSSSGWGAGTTHATGMMEISNSDPDSVLIGPEVDTLRLQTELGFVIDSNLEINGVVDFVDQDFNPPPVLGGGSASAFTVLLGGRFYLVTPATSQTVGVYGQARAGVSSVEVGIADTTEFAWSAAGGVVWWPWGVPRGMGIDIKVEYLSIIDFQDTIALLLGIGFWF